jgi:hypothetical protein
MAAIRQGDSALSEISWTDEAQLFRCIAALKAEKLLTQVGEQLSLP